MTHLATPLGETAPVRSGAILAGQGNFTRSPAGSHHGAGAATSTGAVPGFIARPFAAPFISFPVHGGL